MNHVEKLGLKTDLEYDIIFPTMLEHRRFFISSEYNTDEKGEYECILNYLIDEIKV
tara:strand:+ start:620 stop:787 length:168 start_codon:yes stop_codon:yes gene_type:complete